MSSHEVKTRPREIGTSRLWKTYRRGLRRQVWRSWWFWARAIYGGLGLIFVMYLALSPIETVEDRSQSLAPPSAWYWSWLVDSSHVLATPSPFSTAEDETTASWGTDLDGRDIRLRLSNSMGDYLIWGLLAAATALLLGLSGALLSTWPIRPRLPEPQDSSLLRRATARLSSGLIEATDTIPKFLIVLGVFALFRADVLTFCLGIGLFLSLGIASLVRGQALTYLNGEHYRYAVEVGLSPTKILLRHLVARRLLPILLVQLPFMIAAFIMWEATLSIINFTVPNFESHSLGRAIWDGVVPLITANCEIDPEKCALWPFWIPFIVTMIGISSLYVLGDSFRQLAERDST